MNVLHLGCKKLRALLLSADDPIESSATAIKEYSPPRLSPIHKTKVNTTDAVDEEREDDSTKQLGILCDKIDFSDRNMPLVTATCAESKNITKNVKNAVDTSLFGQTGSTERVATSTEGEASNMKRIDEKSAPSIKIVFDDEDRIHNNIYQMKKLSNTKPSLQECLHQQIEALVENLNTHRKKVQCQLDLFLKNSSATSPTVVHQDYFNSEEDLVHYWTEIAVLNGRLDSLLMHYNGKGDISKKIDAETIENRFLRGISEKTLNNLRNEKRNKGKDCVYSTVKSSTCDISERNGESCSEIKHSKTSSPNEKDKDSSCQAKGQRIEMPSSKPSTGDSLNRVSKQRQLNMRSSSNMRTNANYSGNSSHDHEGVYNGNNSAVFYNTQGYPFGYNNHFISGNNFYGYPPSYTQHLDQKPPRNNRQGGGGGGYHSETKMMPSSLQHHPALDRRDRGRDMDNGSTEESDSTSPAGMTKAPMAS